MADDEIQTVIGEPNTVEGSLTRIGVNKTTGDVENVTIDGTKYLWPRSMTPTPTTM